MHIKVQRPQIVKAIIYRKTNAGHTTMPVSMSAKELPYWKKNTYRSKELSGYRHPIVEKSIKTGTRERASLTSGADKLGLQM